MITFKATLKVRTAGAIRRVKAATAEATWKGAAAILAEAQRRVKKGATHEVEESLQIVGKEGDLRLRVGSVGGHGGRPVARFLETGTAHSHAQPFLRPAATLGRKVLREESRARVLAEAAKTEAS